MAVRRPLYYDGTELVEMTDAMVAALKDEAIRQYIANPSVGLSVITSGTGIGGISNVRYDAGSGLSGTKTYPSTTNNQVTLETQATYDRVQQSVESLTEPADSGKSYPVYYNNGLRPMSKTDMLDTFIYPAINDLYNTDIYYVHTSSTGLTGYTLVSGTLIYRDTIADVANYASGNLYEARDQQINHGNYYLWKKNTPARNTNFQQPMYVTAGNDVQNYTDSGIATSLKDLVRYHAANTTSYRIRYRWNGAGNTQGGSIVDHKVDLSGTERRTQFINADDYRAQEVPTGTAVVHATYNLKQYLV